EPAEEGIDRFLNDPASAEVDFFGEDGYELLAPTWDLDWQPWEEGRAVSYVTEPFTESVVLGGGGYLEVFMRVPDGSADVQASLAIIRPDDTEWSITSGLLRLSDRAVADSSEGLRIDRSYSA